MTAPPFRCPTCLRAGAVSGLRALCADGRCPDARTWVLTPRGWFPVQARSRVTA